MNKKEFIAKYISDINSEPILIGNFSTQKEASEESYNFFRKHGLCADVDTYDEIVNSLTNRGFFLSAYAPRELIVETT